MTRTRPQAPLVWVLRAPAALSQWAPKLSHEYWLCESGQSVLRVREGPGGEGGGGGGGGGG